MTRRVVVVGGGFAGVSAAQELAKQLRKQHRLAGEGEATPGDAIEVLLLNRDNYFVFQPLLADIISGTIETTHAVVPLRRMLPGCGVEVGYVETIDVGSQVVQLRRRMSGQLVPVRYDALIVALGSVTDLVAVPGMVEHGVGIRTLGDAFYLRNRALDMLEEARIEPDPERRQRLLTFVVAGGGSTGVEVAAELKDLVELAARSFRDVRLEPRVVLVHSRSIVLSELGERLGRYATKKLREAGLDLLLGRRVARVDVDRVQLDDGTTIAAATVVSTVGNAPNPALAAIPGPRDGRGWLRPDATFALPGVDNVWALGDCASIVDPKTGRPMPATAQHAVREGPHAARNVLAALEGRPQTPFDYGQLGMLVSVGRFKAVGDVLGVKVSGLLGWFLWRSYYLLRLPTLDRRIRVAIDWTLDLILKHDIVEIGVRRTRARPGEVPGELPGEPVSIGARPETGEELTL
ncbi:MAG TPA: NAD(P)/FAD-dependent oxidoreductase [Candidatus Limnocylindrales bacterium]|nr:NAD(P)/FAD-dependent oxidoreductase [Candidatus Limnocylindrales bacterium]